MVQKVISSGQAGVAQAALRAASCSGVAVGGWCPPDLQIEESLRAEYGLMEPLSDQITGVAELADGVATDWNVKDADVTLVFRPGNPAIADPMIDGTFAAAHRHGKAVLVCDPADAQVSVKVFQWLQKTDAWIVNVAGPSEAAAPGIADQVQAVLLQVFANEKAAVEQAEAILGRKEEPEVRRARMQNDAAWKIRRLRALSGLNQLDLARMMGTSRSAIYRLEDPRYWGHSLPVLRRLAAAVGTRVEIRFVPNGEPHGGPPPEEV
ncbi:transcriptional regulator, XRE family [Chthoniobacter flavus Ellin428]|uniref:Transcriptional regulator, XRE family n=1 Tax=Chthoniobacter flavus Ellin428 TaxID=497964 RepID=B4D3X1_9BACT|nr:putative molybdenum carrier protein [Chthoniobacter flavus]EDY18951.1 transcriptional regulator, XRE family [Chthoniobacter flavus Ellin428]TCO93535.1 DNA-binding XRE family transcriptional regulator [Chthoniobacter flavus]